MDETLRRQARERLDRGRLPRAAGTRVWAAHGTGESSCAVCTRAIAPGHLEMRIEWDEDRRRCSAALHLSCFGAWRSLVSDDVAYRDREFRVRR